MAQKETGGTMSVPTGGSTFNGTGGLHPGMGLGGTNGIGGQWAGGSISVGGSGCGACYAYPSCDSGDVQVNADQCVNSQYPCYGRTACCVSIVCMVTGTSGTGGSNPGSYTGGAHATGGKAAGNDGSYTGGSYATGGTSWNATGGSIWDATGGSSPGYPNANCTYGQNQTCNGDPTASVVTGVCESSGWCTCNDPYVIIPATGKCDTKARRDCYSPTQNIDKAYVDRAFGCACNSTTSQPYCGIDSAGLAVYLYCTSSNVWQSGSTATCVL